MNNINKFVETVIKNEVFEKLTGNKFKVLTTKPYEGKGDLPNGVVLTLLVLEDHAPEGFYGTKADGTPREGIQFQNVSVTIANGQKEKTMRDLHAGDDIALLEFDSEHSFYIDYNLILRYRGYRKLNGANDAQKNR